MHKAPDLDQIAKRCMDAKMSRTLPFSASPKIFRSYTRAEIARFIGYSSGGLGNNIRDLEEHLGESIGKIGANGQPYYSLKEIYQIFDFLIGRGQGGEKKELSRSKARKIPKPLRSPTGLAFVTTITNLKGGAGKTTTAIYNAIATALEGFERPRVLLLDMDPQGHVQQFLDGRYQDMTVTPTASKILTRKIQCPEGINYDQWLRDSLVQKSHIDNLDFIPAFPNDSSMEAVFAELQYSQAQQGDFHGIGVNTMLSELIIDPLRPHYDFIFVDTGPHNNYGVWSSVFASQGLLISAPTRPMDSDATLTYMELVRDKMNQMKQLGHPGMEMLCVLPVMYDKNIWEQVTIRDEYKFAFGDCLLPAEIGYHPHLNKVSQDMRTLYDFASDHEYGSKKRSEIIREWDRVAEEIKRCVKYYWLRETSSESEEVA